MTSPFHIKEHVISAAHVREYTHATAVSQEDELKVHVKQYTPKDNPDPQQGDITVIGAHANGFPKVGHETREYGHLELSLNNPAAVRRSTSLCGRSCMMSSRRKGCGCEVSGSRTLRGKDRAAS